MTKNDFFFIGYYVFWGKPPQKWNGYRKLPHNLWLFLEDKVSFGKSEIISSNILDISCWPISKMFQHFSDFQCFILSYKNGHKLGLKLHIQIWFSTLYYHESQRKKMEHELGDWEDSRGPKNDGKQRWLRSMHESVLCQKWMFFVILNNWKKAVKSLEMVI